MKSRTAHAITVFSLSVLSAPWLTACPAADEARGIGDAPARAGDFDSGVRSESPDGSVASGLAGEDNDPSFQSCFNGIDENETGDADCDDAVCANSPPCCVGATREACCAVVPQLQNLDLTACADPRTCAQMRVVSGFPVITAAPAHRLTLVSSADVDAIVDFPSWAVTPRAERVVLRASISARTISTLRVDAAAFGLWQGNTSATSANPDIGVVVSATRGDVSLIVGSRIVSARAMADEVDSYALSIEPSGSVTLTAYREGLLVSSETQSITLDLPSGRVIPVLFGRVTNDEVGAASITAFSVARSVCDIPAALARADSLTFVGGDTFDAHTVSDPSVILHGDITRIAFAARARAGNSARSLFVGTLDGNVVRDAFAVIMTANLTGLGTINDLSGPDIVARADGRIDMHFAYRVGDIWDVALARDVLGKRSIVPVTTPTGSFDDPTLLGAALIVRSHVDGGTRFVRLDANTEDGAFSQASVCGTNVSCAPGAMESAFILKNSGEEIAFDRDEIRSAAVVQTDSTTRVYYAGRRGTRWSIGMLQSNGAGFYFRSTNEGEALLTGSGSGSDALSVSTPTAWVDGDMLHLVYAGSDGVNWTLLRASQPIYVR